MVSFPENVYVIICSTGPRRSDYTNISGNGPKIFQIFIAKASCNHTGSNSLTETSSCERWAEAGSEGDDAKEEIPLDESWFTLRAGRGEQGKRQAQKVHNHRGSLLTLVGTLNVIIFS